ncbi:apolipophorin [Carabus blaptoides fortunei]
MARFKGPFTLCAAALFLCTITNTHAADKCPSGCGGVTPNIFKYQEGTTYKYNLDGNIDISVSSAENQQTSTKVRATVLLSQQAACNQVLRIQNLQIIGPDAKKYGNLANIEKPIRLNVHDGHVEDHICAEPGDTQNSLNIKRAVASMFQVSLKDNYENDVFGKCPSDTSSRKEGNVFIIQKRRDLNQCGHRESVKQDFMATSFNFNAGLTGSPLIADYESEQRVKNGILDHATVTENYLYKPFSNGKDHGVKAVVTTKLNYAGQSKEKPTAKCTESKSIYFESPHQETTKTANVDSILNALKETKKSMDVSVSETSAATFAQLIKVLRASKKDDILAVYGQVRTGAGGFTDKKGARKVFFDALFRTGTGEAVEVVVQLLKNKELSEMEQKLVYLSLAFIRHATEGSLASAALLLDQPNLPREAFLGIGTLAGRFCREHSCDNVAELNKLMDKLITKLVPHPANRKAENEAIAVLKALGNVHHLNEHAVDKIIQIANDKKAPTRLRVAALEAAQNDACKAKFTNAALNILKNRQEDSEIRIKAYLVVAECPDNKVATALKELLDTEPVYQVGGFIVSHLRNLRASANPDREHAKQFLNNVRTTKHFPIDPRKFSFNNEISYNMDSFGSGNTLESNVIYSQNSFLPRSINLNMTTEMFGHSFNFLEIGARQENLDKVLEHYFGPLGVLNSHSEEELYTAGKDGMQKIIDQIKHRVEKTRGKRDVSRNEIEAFAKQIKVLGSELNKDLELDTSVKIFGSELLFLSINEDIQKLTPEAIIDELFDALDQGIDKAKNFEYHIKEHLLFMDSELTYPTSIGFPLRCNIQGASAMHFITSGNIDIRQVLSDPKNAQIKLKLIPSANVQISGGLNVDAHFVKTGLKITSNVLTSTGTDLTLKLVNGVEIDVKMGLPVDKQVLMSFSHDLEFASQELGKPESHVALEFKDKPKEFSICFDQLRPIIGLDFCGTVNTPPTLASNQVGFPLNGNMKLELFIERDDVSEYHFKAALAEPNPHSKTLEITFNTPNSKADRHLTLILEATTKPNKALRATLKSPFKTATAEAVITDTAEEKSIMAQFQFDNSQYLAKIGVAVKGNAAKQIYRPLIEYQTPNDIVKTKGNRKPDYTVEGQVIYEQTGETKKYTFDHVKLISPGQPAILVNGYIAREGPTTYSADLAVKRESVTVNSKGKIQFGPNSLKLNAEMQNSVNPSANFNLKLETSHGDREYDNSIILIHGDDLSSKKHCLTIIQSAKYKYDNPEQYEFGTKNKVSYPLLGLEAKLDLHTTRKHVEYDFVVGYDKFKLKSELDAKLATKQLGDYDVEFEVEVMNNKVELKAKRDIVGEKSNIANSLEITGKKYSVDGTVTHHIKPNDINVGADLVLKVADKSEPIKLNTGLVSNLQKLDTHCKITIGSTNTVDIVIKGVRGANPSGTLSVFVVNLVDAKGQFRTTGGKSTGHVVIDIPKLGRKIKAETSITCQDPTHNVMVNVYFDFEKDNTNKLHIETNNEINPKSFESKNKIQFVNHKLEANAKGKMDGKFDDGTMSGDFDVLLPNGHYITGNLNRELHVVSGVANGHAEVSLQCSETKGAPAKKLSIKGEVKNTNFKKHIVDLLYHIVAENHDGKNIQADIKLVHNHDGTKHNSLVKTKLYGSAMTNPLEYEYDTKYDQHEGEHKLTASYGPKLATQISGKYSAHGPGTPSSGSLNLQATLPNDNVHHIELSLGGNVKEALEADGKHEAGCDISATINKEKKLSLKGHVEASRHEGKFDVDLTMPNGDPLGLGGNYKREKTEHGGKCHCDLHLKYAKDKEVKAGMNIHKVSDDEVDADLDLVTSVGAVKHINLQLKNKKSGSGKHYHNEIILTADEKRYGLANELIISEISPSLDVNIKYPDGKNSRIYAKINKKGAQEYSGEVKIDSINDFSLDASGEANLESIDNFHILINVHSEKLKLEKIRLEALNKPAKGGKRIQFSAKSGDKNLLSGSTSYKANEEGGKFIVEGSGSVKVKDETKTATFKFMRQQLVQEKNGEHGVEVLLNANIGSQGIVGELKLTNKQFRLLNSYCEEKKQCAHVEVFTKSNTVDATEFNHELEVNIDLRKLGLSHEFGLKAVTIRKDFVLDHTVDIHFESSANSKYQYSLYVHPKEAGIQFTTPKRVVALEAKGDLPINNNKLGHIKGEVALYMNKKAEPNKKTVLSYNSDQDYNEKNGHLSAELKFSNPALGKDFLIQYGAKYDLATNKVEFNVDVDIFAKKNQKISVGGFTVMTKLDQGYKFVSNLNAASKGLNLDLKASEVINLEPQNLHYELKCAYQLEKIKQDNIVSGTLNPKKAEILLKLLNHNLLHIDSKLQISKDSQVADTKISAVGITDAVSHVEIKNFNTFIFTLAKKATPQHKLQISTGFILGQIADARAEILKGATKHDLIHASIKLDDANFMKPDFGLNVENIQNMLLNELQKQNTHCLEALKALAEDYQKTISHELNYFRETAQKAMPNFKPAAEYYKQELLKLKDELITDKTIQEMSEVLRKIFGTIITTASDIYTILNDTADRLIVTLSEHVSKITDIIAKDILPNIKNLLTNVLDIYMAIAKDIYDLAMIYIVKVTDILKAHQDDLKRIASVLSEAFQDVGRLFVKFFNQVKEDMAVFANEIYEQIKALHIFEELKESYNQLFGSMPVPEQVLNVVNEFCGTIKDTMPTEELRHFVGVVQDYIGKKLRKEDVDDVEALKQIYVSLMKALDSLIFVMVDQQPEAQFNYKNILENAIPIRLDRLYTIPKLAAARFSPLTLLLNREFPALKELLYSVSLNPRHHILPFGKQAIIAQGQHIFTFDDRHLTFPGQCAYVLAKDATNGNFSIVGDYKDGHLESLTFSDKHDTVTIKRNHAVTLNGHPSELPIRHKELQVFRTQDTVQIKSKAGVLIVAKPDLNLIGVYVSGFYHSQLRGLLGNGNYEPHDDLTMPNGKITASETEFGNAFKLRGACAAVKTVDHHTHHANPACDALFGEQSAFSLCYPIVNPDNFRQACEHGLASGDAEAEKYIAMAYVLRCRTRGVPLMIPSKFLECDEGDQMIPLGGETSVKVPGKSADIFVVVEQNKHNEQIYKELVQPLVTQVQADLTAKGFNDFEYVLMSYGGGYTDYPTINTHGGNIISTNGKLGNLKFEDPKPRAPIDTGNEQLNELVERLIKLFEEVRFQLGDTPGLDALAEVMKYKFRSAAVKVVLFVRGETTTKFQPLLHLVKYGLAASGPKYGLYFNTITPLEHLQVTGKDQKLAKAIVGFNDHSAFTLADAKKKGDGSAELRNELDYGLDLATDYTLLRHKGNVFPSNVFLQAKGGQRKNFIQVAAHMITDKIFNTEQVLDCQCRYDFHMGTRNVCKVVSVKEKEPLHARKGGVKG